MKDEYMNYKILRKIQQEEKSSPLLTKIDDHFFEEATKYLSMLHDRLKKEDKPSRNIIISEQIQQVENIIKSIYEIREKKIILAAMAKARGGTPSEKHFLPMEKDLFTSVYAQLNDHRKIYLDHDTTSASQQQKKPITHPEKKDEHEHTDQKKQSTASIPTSDHSIIRVTDHIPTFVGTDTKQYHLRKHDILSIPSDLANMLIQKKVAEPVDMKT